MFCCFEMLQFISRMIAHQRVKSEIKAGQKSFRKCILIRLFSVHGAVDESNFGPCFGVLQSDNQMVLTQFRWLGRQAKYFLIYDFISRQSYAFITRDQINLLYVCVRQRACLAQDRHHVLNQLQYNTLYKIIISLIYRNVSNKNFIRIII